MPGFGTATRRLVNSGMKRDTGSSRRTRPSSTSVRIAAAVTGFEEEAIANKASLRMGVFATGSRNPWAS